MVRYGDAEGKHRHCYLSRELCRCGGDCLTNDRGIFIHVMNLWLFFENVMDFEEGLTIDKGRFGR